MGSKDRASQAGVRYSGLHSTHSANGGLGGVGSGEGLRVQGRRAQRDSTNSPLGSELLSAKPQPSAVILPASTQPGKEEKRVRCLAGEGERVNVCAVQYGGRCGAWFVKAKLVDVK